MKTTEAEAMKDVMNLLEMEPSACNSGGEWKLQGVPWG